jgi:hypothetical protein
VYLDVLLFSLGEKKFLKTQHEAQLSCSILDTKSCLIENCCANPRVSRILLFQNSFGQHHNINNNVDSAQKTASSWHAYWPQTLNRSNLHFAVSSTSACFHAYIRNCKWRRAKPINTGRDSSLRASSYAKARRRRFEPQLKQRSF